MWFLPTGDDRGCGTIKWKFSDQARRTQSLVRILCHPFTARLTSFQLPAGNRGIAAIHMQVSGEFSRFAVAMIRIGVDVGQKAIFVAFDGVIHTTRVDETYTWPESIGYVSVFGDDEGPRSNGNDDVQGM